MARKSKANTRRTHIVRLLERLTESSAVAIVLTIAALAIGLITLLFSYFVQLLPDLAYFEGLDIRSQLESKHPPEIIGDFIYEHSVFTLGLLIPAALALIPRWRITVPALFVFSANGLIATAVLGAEIAANWESAMVSSIGKDPSQFAYIVKLILIAISTLTPSIVFLYYRTCSTMDRYTLRNFGFPFLLCLIGFVIIALLLDLQDNFADFAGSKASIWVIVAYYVTIFPQIIVTFTPIALLLSLLYTLSKMSRANEIISMLGTGRSMISVLKPVFFVGVLASLVCLTFNYHWAPESAGRAEAQIDSINKGEDPDSRATSQYYINTNANRSWYVGRIPFDLVMDKMRGIEITQTDEEGRVQKKYLAKSARWWPGGDTSPPMWTLYHGITIEFDENNVEINRDQFNGDGTEESPDRYDVLWDETPWQVIGATMRADHMGTPELTSYIRANKVDKTEKDIAPFFAHWHYNLATPWTCLVVVLIAAPLGIVFSRRGVLAGVATAILIFFGILVVDNIFLSLGKAGHISPFIAAWGPRAIFGFVGLVFLVFRARNRELPKLNPAQWIRNYKAAHAS